MKAWLLLTEDGHGVLRRIESVELAPGVHQPDHSTLKVGRAEVNNSIKGALAESLKKTAHLSLTLLAKEFRFERSLVKIAVVTEPTQFEIKGASVDLALGLASFVEMARQLGYWPQASEVSFAATGEVDASGSVRSVDKVAAKLDAALAALMPGNSFLFYPEADEGCVSDAHRSKARERGFHLRGVRRLQHALEHLGCEISDDTGKPPFISLETQTFSRSRLFFGRQREVEDLCKQLEARQDRLGRSGVLVVAGSGTGKSSVVLAGVLPALKKAADNQSRALEFAVWQPDAAGRAAAERAIVQSIVASWARADDDQTGFRTVPRGADTLAALGEAAVSAWSHSAARRIWVVDQLEKLFTTLDARLQVSLAELLRTLYMGGVWVLATMRREYYDRYQDLSDSQGRAILVDIFGDQGIFDLRALVDENLRQVIARPVQLTACKFEVLSVNAARELQMPERAGSSLEDIVFEDALGAKNPLPLLSYALTQLVEKAKPDEADGKRLLLCGDYFDNGRLAGAIDFQAGRVFNSAELSDAARSELKSVLFALSKPIEGKKDDAKEDSKGESAVPAEMSRWAHNKPAVELIDALATKARVLVIDRPRGSVPQVHVAHEALFSSWELAAKLLQGSHEDRLDLARWNARAGHWLDSNRHTGWLARSEEKRIAQVSAELGDAAPEYPALDRLRRESAARRRKNLGIATVLVGIIAAGVTVGLVKLQKQAADSGVEATAATNRAAASAVETTKATRRAAADAFIVAANTPAPGQKVLAFSQRMQFLLASMKLDPKPEAKNALGQMLFEARHLQKIVSLNTRCIDLAVTAAGDRIICAQEDGTLQSWSMPGLRRGSPAIKSAHGPVVKLLFAARDKALVAVAATGEIDILDGATLQPVGALASVQGLTAITVSPDGDRLAVAASNGLLRIVSLATRQPVAESRNQSDGAASSLLFSADGRQLLAARSGGSVSMLDSASLRTGWSTSMGMQQTVYAMALSADGSRIAIGGVSRTVSLLDARTGRILMTSTDRHDDTIFRIVFSRRGDAVVSAGADGKILAWKAATLVRRGEPFGLDMGRLDGFGSFGGGDGGDGFVTSTLDRSLRVWSVNDTPPTIASEVPSGPMRGTAIDPEGSRLAAGGESGIVSMRAIDGSAICQTAASVPGSAVSAIAFGGAKSARILAVGHENGTIRLWNPANCASLSGPLTGHQEFVSALAFSPDGATFASASMDGSVRLWDAGTQRLRMPPVKAHQSGVFSLAFSPAGDALATGGGKGMLVFLDPRTGQEIFSPIAHRGPVTAIAYAAGGAYFVTGSGDRHVRRFDTAQRLPVGREITLGGPAESLAISRDGEELAASSLGGRLDHFIFSERDDRGFGLQVDSQGLYSLASSPDGSMIATAGVDGLRLWPGPSAWVAKACELLSEPGLDESAWRSARLAPEPFCKP